MNIICAAVLGVVGVMLLAMGVLGRLERLPRNALIGYRLPVLLESDGAWRRGHRAAWVPTVIAGAACLVGAIGACASRSDDALSLWALGVCTAILALCILGLVLAVRAAGGRAPGR